MNDTLTRRICGILFTVLAVVACSAEEPAAPAPSAAAPAASEAPASPPPAAADEPDAVAAAQAMDDAESAADSNGDAADEPVRLAATSSADSPAASSRFKEGTHYRVLPVAQPTGAPPGKVEVAEVFWYGCPHCYSLEPYIKEWRADGKPANASFVRIPAALNANWQVHARVYYAAEALGVLDEVHEEIFREVHTNRNALMSEEALVEFFGRYGVSEEDFLEAFNSFAVTTKLRRSDSLVRRYRITGVPAMVVNGKYVTGADLAGGEEPMFEVVNFLIEKESQ